MRDDCCGGLIGLKGARRFCFCHDAEGGIVFIFYCMAASYASRQECGPLWFLRNTTYHETGDNNSDMKDVFFYE